MRVLVLWADDASPNLGVRVLARGAQRLWTQARPGDEFVFQDFRAGETGHALDRAVVLRDAVGLDRRVSALLDEADIVLDTGAGDSFTDIYGRKRLALMTYVRQAAYRRRLPLVLMPQTIGPFRHRTSKVVARRTLATAVLAIARDPASAREAADLGRPADCVATDVVFALPAPSQGPSRDILMNVSGLLWYGEGGLPADKYRAAVRETIEALRAAGRTVTLLAHVLDNRWRDNDVLALRDLSAEMRGSLEIVVPDGLNEARALMAGSSLVVGSRMHACLNALSVGTPAVPLAYSRKFAPLMADLGWNYTIDLRDFDGAAARVASLAASESLASDLCGLRERASVRLGRAVDAIRSVDWGH